MLALICLTALSQEKPKRVTTTIDQSTLFIEGKARSIDFGNLAIVEMPVSSQRIPLKILCKQGRVKVTYNEDIGSVNMPTVLKQTVRLDSDHLFSVAIRSNYFKIESDQDGSGEVRYVPDERSNDE